MEACRQRRDVAPGRASPQLLQRKVGRRIRRARVLPIDRDVRDAQIVILRGIARIDGEELGGPIVGRTRSLIALAGLERRRGGDDGEAAA
jgi:hypothetical protein